MYTSCTSINICFIQTKDAMVPISVPSDPVDRDIEYTPTKAPYDPVWMLAGKKSGDTWLSGFFDKV